MLAMFLEEVGQAAYSHDAWLLSLQMSLGIAVFAALLGAPLAVPVALLVRLRNVWLCLPFIVIAAAVGLAIQFWINGQLDDGTSALGFFSNTVYVIPAAFGTAAALLLRWRERLAIVALPLAIVLFVALFVEGGHDLQPAHVAAQHWSVLHVGMAAYTGGYNRGQTVCPSLSAYLNVERDRPQGCRTVANATPVIVDAIFPCKPDDPDHGWGAPHVRLHARNGSWNGFTTVADLQPDVPVGIPLDFERDWGAPLDLIDDRGASKVIGGSAIARLLRYDPKRDYSLYVEIVSGKYRGAHGWMAIQVVDTGGVALGQYSLQYPYEGC
jgi:hypothetical protein